MSYTQQIVFKFTVFLFKKGIKKHETETKSQEPKREVFVNCSYVPKIRLLDFARINQAFDTISIHNVK